MNTSDFDFELPPERIAQQAIEPRDQARLLRVTANALSDHHVYDLPDLLRPGDLLVMNDTRVIPARIYGRRVRYPLSRIAGKGASHSEAGEGTPNTRNAGAILKSDQTLTLPAARGPSLSRNAGEGKIEVLLHKKHSGSQWLAFARPGKRLRVDDKIEFAPEFFAEIHEKHEGGEILLQFNVADYELLALLHKYGEPPLPPYIKREAGAAKLDIDRYQTIYAARDGAVAAPTAGLHFTPELLEKLENKGIDRAIVTLHVGAGTFLPVKVDDIKDHVMHEEWGEVTQTTADQINRARKEKRRIIAVGTTSLRVVESAADENGMVRPFSQDTSIFITPGYRFRVIDALMTNFHLPQSTLFMLVSAFMGLDAMRQAYDYAIKENYRFYSYGDASLLERQ